MANEGLVALSGAKAPPPPPSPRYRYVSYDLVDDFYYGNDHPIRLGYGQRSLSSAPLVLPLASPPTILLVRAR